VQYLYISVVHSSRETENIIEKKSKKERRYSHQSKGSKSTDRRISNISPIM
jgi:hypothetical protein